MLGLLMAFAMRYGVDLNQTAKPETDDIMGIEVEMDANQDGVIDDACEQRSAVYYDSASGKYCFDANNWQIQRR